MSKNSEDFSYLKDAINEDDIARSKGKKKKDLAEEKNRNVAKRCPNISRK